MSAKKYKGVLIVGIDNADNRIQAVNTLIKAYKKEGYKIIGSPEKGFEFSDLNTLDGMIDNNTRIVITAHGLPHSGEHVILCSDEYKYTGDLLEILNLYSKDSPLNIILSSCYAGLASNEANILSRGSVLITHGLGNKTTNTDLGDYSLKLHLSTYKAYSSLFEEFINEFLIHSMQTSIISVSQGRGKEPLTFEVRPNLQDAFKTPEKTLSKIQTDLLEFYSSLHIKSNNFEVRELTAQEISEFQKGYFIYNCFIGNTAIVELLNSNGESIAFSNLVNTRLESTYPLHLAAYSGHSEIVNALLQHNADVDKPGNDDGATPLYIASQKGHLETVKVLLQHNADANKAISDGAIPLYIAAQNDHLEIVKILLQHNADVDKAINNGATPILLAICFKKDAIAKELISHSKKIWNDKSKESKVNIKSIEKYCPSELDHYYNLVEEAKSHHHEEL